MLSLFLCLVFFSPPSAGDVPIIRIDQEYTHDVPKSSWITINLAHPTSTIKSILWCKSITPNIKRPAPINDCKGAGLTHLELYPSRVKILPEEPNVVYVDPEEIGGWDTEHQFDIIVLADVKERDAQLLQVVRFNAAAAAPPLGGASNPPPVGIASVTPPLGGVSVTNPLDDVSNAEPVGSAFPITPPKGGGGGGGGEQPVHPWLATAIVFCVGIFIFVVLGSLMVLKKRKLFERAYTPLKRDEQEAVEMQDLSILMKLGKGANEAFKMNL